jgi:hypothetical protein
MNKIVYKDYQDEYFNPAKFCLTWKNRPGDETIAKIFFDAEESLCAVDKETNEVVGVVTAMTDGHWTACISIIEVMEEYQGQGIKAGLVSGMKERLSLFHRIDLLCEDKDVYQYRPMGFLRQVGLSFSR